MHTYSATFSDGTTITRKTERQYKVAWRASWTNEAGKVQTVTGFAATREGASPDKPTPYYSGRGFSSRHRAEAKRKNDEYRKNCGYSVEFADAALV